MTTSCVRRWRRCDAMHGLTLVELLVTIMIIGILSSSVLFAMSAAQESARRSRTRAIIATLHSLVMERWDTYLTRRINLDAVQEIAAYQSGGPKAAAVLRLGFIRRFMKADFPDNWEDVEKINTGAGALLPAATGYLPLAFWFWRSNIVNFIATDTSLTTAAQRTARLDQNEGAECLYMFIWTTRSDNSRWQKIGEDFIGDTDKDSALEFLDGWGRPINFIRWPAGFASDVQKGQPGSVAGTFQAANEDHDPFDPLWAEQAAYRLVPLIISAGPDGLFDVAVIDLDYAVVNDVNNRWNPYYVKGGRRAGETGYDQNSNGQQDWHDNIHNHLLNTR